MTTWWHTIEFADKEWFWALLLIPALAGWYIYRIKRKDVYVVFSNLPLLKNKQSLKPILKHVLFGFEMIAAALIISALARPQSSGKSQEVITEGIDIVLSLDISGSMLARDFEPNRLEVSRNLALDFIDSREHDRIGLTIFAGEAFTQCPLTTDHSVLKNLFRDVDFGMVKDGTAIGSGLAVSINRLRESEAESKVVILLTDGVNNAGDVPPLTAAEIAQKMGVTVYTIGVGTTGTAPMPVRTMDGRTVYQNEPVYIDEKTLQEISRMTGGKYFRAENEDQLKEIYELIDDMEKTKIEVKEYSKKKDEFVPLALIGGALLFLSFFLKMSFLRTIA